MFIRILVLSPNIDGTELGTDGTIIKFIVEK